MRSHRKHSSDRKRDRSRSRSRSRGRRRSHSRRSRTGRSPRKRKSQSRTAPSSNVAPITKPTSPKAASSEVPDWLADLFPQSGVQAPPPVPAKPQVVATPLEIPLHLAPLLMADNNMAVKRISAASGAEIAVRQDMQHLGYSLVIITGTVEATVQAKDMVLQHVGLTGGSNVVKEIKIPGDPMRAIGAVELVLAELRHKANGVQIKIVPSESLGERVTVIVGPGPVAHVAVAENLIRKKIADLALDLCYKQGRPVPAELKIPVVCKFFSLGSCSLGGKCQYCHGPEELEVAQRVANPLALGSTGKAAAPSVPAAVAWGCEPSAAGPPVLRASPAGELQPSSDCL